MSIPSQRERLSNRSLLRRRAAAGLACLGSLTWFLTACAMDPPQTTTESTSPAADQAISSPETASREAATRETASADEDQSLPPGARTGRGTDQAAATGASGASPSPAGAAMDPVARTQTPLTSSQAEQVVATALELPGAVEASAEDGLASVVQGDLVDVAAGPMRAELEAELIEMDSQGWSREGEPVLSQVTILDGDVDGGQILVQACVDWSEVTYVDADGSPVPSNPTPRALQTFSLTHDDNGRWVVHSRQLPDDPRC